MTGWVIVAILLVASSSDEVARDLKTLQGTWTVVKFMIEDVGFDDADDIGTKYVFTGNQLIMKQSGKKDVRVRIELDSKASPKVIRSIHLTQRSLPPLVGIYKLQGDILTLCYAANRKNRPKRFSDKSAIVLKLKKEK